MKTKLIIYALAVLSVSNGAQAQPPESNTVPVTIENYNRAQTDVYFAGVVKNGGFGQFRHGRELAPPVQQGIVRPNRDTLYSFMIADLDAAPVTITLPDAGKHFMEMQVVNQDQYTRATYYDAGSHSLTRAMIGTRYAIAVVRFLVNFSDKEDVQQVHALQDAIELNQKSPGTFEVPHWIWQVSRKCRWRCWATGNYGIRYAPHVRRRRKPGRSGQASDRNRYAMGRQPREGCALSAYHAGAQ